MQEEQLWAQAEVLFEQSKQFSEEMNLRIPELGLDIGWLVGTAIAITAVSPAQAVDNYVFGRCTIATQSEGAEIRPIYDGGIYLVKYHGNDSRYAKKLSVGNFFENAKIRLIKAPAHGQVALADVPDVFHGQYHYVPKEGYLGRDRFVMQVEENGIKVRIQYLIWVIGDDEATGGLCRSEEWKISLPNPGDNPALANVLTAASQALSFADLTGSSVGQATGTGANAQITLDTDAAGHGWYIDQTPYLNDEYLPTSNPNLWIAREGSEAAGKMDLLSVLLHEYGHALGLEHSADAGNFMATTLQPGQRRLPSAEELDLMAGLLGVAREAGAASPVPYDPFSPPGSPLPMTMSLAAFVATRQRHAASAAALTRFAVVANPALEIKRNGQTKILAPSETGWSVANAVEWSGRLTDTDNPGEKNALRRFLSIYSLTRDDGSPDVANGGWEDIVVQNGDAVKRQGLCTRMSLPRNQPALPIF